jgi:hypothetical protein
MVARRGALRYSLTIRLREKKWAFILPILCPGMMRCTLRTLGIVSAYLDDNAYSSDEYTQFMNQALVNDPHALLPAYGAGVAGRGHRPARAST